MVMRGPCYQGVEKMSKKRESGKTGKEINYLGAG